MRGSLPQLRGTGRHAWAGSDPAPPQEGRKPRETPRTPQDGRQDTSQLAPLCLPTSKFPLPPSPALFPYRKEAAASPRKRGSLSYSYVHQRFHRPRPLTRSKATRFSFRFLSLPLDMNFHTFSVTRRHTRALQRENNSYIGVPYFLSTFTNGNICCCYSIHIIHMFSNQHVSSTNTRLPDDLWITMLLSSRAAPTVGLKKIQLDLSISKLHWKKVPYNASTLTWLKKVSYKDTQDSCIS
jgi:hypothetical protein